MKKTDFAALVIILAALFLLVGCFDSGSDNSSGPTEGANDNAPWIWISYPAQWGTVSGMEEVRVEAGPVETVDSVLLFVDGALSGSDPEAPYSFGWNVDGLTGSHTLFARVIAGDDSIDSGLITVSIADSSDNELPSIFITSPTVWETVQGIVPVLVEASDNRGVEKVLLLVDGIVRDSLLTEPYEFTWDTSSDTLGNHTLLCKAFDAAGNSGISNFVIVTVEQ